MKTLTLTLTLALAILAAAAPAAAQQRIGGLALVGGGALMVLASGKCDPGEGSSTASVIEGGVSVRVYNFNTSGAPWLWSKCGFSFSADATDYYSGSAFRGLTFTDKSLGDLGVSMSMIESARAELRTRNPVMLYGGLAAVAGGVALAVLSGGAGGPPMLDVQAGPRGVRLSRTFGF